MEKRVVIFLILALAIIIGYDYLLKQMGMVQSPPQPDQPRTIESPSASAKGPESPSAPLPVRSVTTSGLHASMRERRTRDLLLRSRPTRL